jgi:hypothetical protein
MRSEQMWLDDEATTGPPSLTRRRVLAGSLKVAGASALALTLAGGMGQGRLAFAQEATPPAADATGEVEGGIQVGTTDDTTMAEGEAAAGAQVEGEAAADGTATDDQTREERRAAREGEDAVGGVAAVPSTGVGAALGSSLGGVLGAIGLAAASVGAALYTRRGAVRGAETGE